MKYVSIDLETTGLDADNCQILQVGLVAEDTLRPDVPVEKLPSLEFLVKHDVIRGELRGIVMNAKLLGRIDSPFPGDIVINAEHVALEIISFARKHDSLVKYNGKEKVQAAGKNFASFDRPFLKDVNCNSFLLHRAFDPGSLYARLDDEVIPDTAECCRRAGLPDQVSHTALADAQQVVHLIRHAMKNRA